MDPAELTDGTTEALEAALTWMDSSRDYVILTPAGVAAAIGLIVVLACDNAHLTGAAPGEETAAARRILEDLLSTERIWQEFPELADPGGALAD